MKKIVIILMAVVCCGSIFCQTVTVTRTFKPGPDVGKDAMIWQLDNNCIPTGYPATPGNINFGAEDGIMAFAWTWAAMGCNSGKFRAFLKFQELSTIPADAQILSAELKLFGANSTTRPVDTRFTLSGSNACYIQRVTSDWNDQTVTWNTQPATTTQNQLTIPSSSVLADYANSSDDLIAMIQDMVSNSQNYGFMFRLQAEQYYRGMIFAGCRYADQTKWPELTITYQTRQPEQPDEPCPPEPCDAPFSAYMPSSLNPSEYIFSAANPADRHTWTVNGRVASNANFFSYIFRPGSHTVCYMRKKGDIGCTSCITLCVSDIYADSLRVNEIGRDLIPTRTKTTTQTDANVNVIQERLLPGDDVKIEDQNKINVYPNPTNTEWKVGFVSEVEETVRVYLSDGNGKIVYSDNKKINIGDNNFIISSNGLQSGVYSLQIVGNEIRFVDNLVKK
ncbi:DNRLRE domain-containing protein [Bacteroidales bacterium OttesenSCG-928-I21]|nr:DNRLRE domain-containing protein [Bacteroidales bacterium OttesenSCG-928-I21]